MSNSYWNGILEKRLSRRRALAYTGATSLSAAILAACGGSDSGGTALQFDDTSRTPGKVWSAANDWKLPDETKQAVRGGIYRSYMEEDQAGPYDAMVLAPSQTPHAAHTNEFYMSRRRGPGIDPASQEAGVPVPMLAESMEMAADGITVTFKLRKGVKWHPIAPVNGRVMDMDDWKTSHERFIASSPQRQGLLDVIDKVEYPDANTMVWKFKFTFAPFLNRVWSERLTYPIYPKELNADPKLAEQIAIGTGYKILDKHSRSVTMEYKKFADYWGGDPFIDRWHTPIIPEYANQYAQFVNGNIMDFQPTARDVLQLAKDVPGAVIVANPIPDDQVQRIRFGRNNQKTLPWKDPRVRAAIRKSINFRGIGELLANKQQFEAAGIPVEVVTRGHLPNNPAYFLDAEKGELGPISVNLTYDAAEAKKMLAAAGFTQPIDIQFWTLPAGGEIIEVDQLSIDSLGQSGNFKVEVIRSPNTVAHRNCRSLGQCDGIVQSSVSEDADYIIERDYLSYGNKEGEQAYPDPRIDRVAEAQRRELDPVKRIELLKEFQRIATELTPVIPYVHQYTQFRFRWPWLHNSAMGFTTSDALPEGRPVAGGHLQWLDKDMPNREKGAL
jgi:ABC-type transport system substrate-binding protein